MPAGPAHPQWNKPPQEFFQPVGFAREVVVHKENELRAVTVASRCGYLANYLVHRPLLVSVVRRGLNGAKLAGQPAATAELDQLDWQIPFAAEDVPVVTPALQQRATIRPVRLLQPAVPEIIQQSRPRFLCVAGNHALGVVGDFIRAKGRVHSAHHHRDAAPAVFARDLVGAARGVGFDAEADKIGRFIERNFLQPVIVETEFDIARSQGRERGGPKGLHLPGAQPAPLAGTPAESRMNERHTGHGTSSSSAGTCQCSGAGG